MFTHFARPYRLALVASLFALLTLACAALPLPGAATELPPTVPPPVEDPPLPTAAPTQPPALSPAPGTPLALFRVGEGEIIAMVSEPGGADVRAELPYGVQGFTFYGGSEVVSGARWMEIALSGQIGWLPAANLVEATDPAAFCANESVEFVLANVMAAISLEDGPALASYTSPTHGLFMRHNWWNNEVWVPAGDVADLFADTTEFEWGIADGSGQPVVGDFRFVLLPELQEVFTAPNVEVHCNDFENGTGPSAGLKQLPPEYHSVNAMLVYRPAGPEQNEFDWASFAVGFEFIDGQPYLLYIVMYRYEI